MSHRETTQVTVFAILSYCRVYVNRDGSLGLGLVIESFMIINENVEASGFRLQNGGINPGASLF